jgi:hypothetical protein
MRRHGKRRRDRTFSRAAFLSHKRYGPHEFRPQLSEFRPCFSGQGLMNVHELSGKWLTEGFAMDRIQGFVIICRKSFSWRAN